MNLLIRSVEIVDSTVPHNFEKVDILIKNGIVNQISTNINVSENTKVIEYEGLCISPGWFDPFVNFCDPGFEHKEDIASGLKAAEAGGFTAVGILPNTQPVIDNKTVVEYIKFKAHQAQAACEVFCIGANTKNTDGIHLAEMYEMHRAGAIAFSGGTKPINNNGTMLRSLQYVLPFNGIIVNLPEDENLTVGGQMNEGIASTQMGTKGKPNMAELMMVQRDIELARYTNSRIHFAQISTEEAKNAIQNAKREGVKVTASVNPLNLVYEDTELLNFDTNWKVNPPLRTKTDRLVLGEGLKLDFLDFVSSFHQPQDEDCKKLEFDKADFGAIGLQTSFSLLIMAGFRYYETVKLLSINSRRIFGLPIPEIKEGEKANFTLFQPKETYILKANQIHSKSKNTPLLGKELTGKVIGVINGDRFSLNE